MSLYPFYTMVNGLKFLPKTLDMGKYNLRIMWVFLPGLEFFPKVPEMPGRAYIGDPHFSLDLYFLATGN